MFDFHGEFADADARGVVRRVGDSGTGQADFADAWSPQLVEFFVRVIEKMHVDRRGTPGRAALSSSIR